jgi:CMP-N-acetylneuraminic acid synthetase
VDARLAALVPMRHESERVPGKNFKPFAGRPLFHWILETLLACEIVAEIVVDTDSPEIANGVARHFPRVRIVKRPPHLRGGDVPTNEIVLHDAATTDAEFLLQTHSTNPLLRPATVGEAAQRFLGSLSEYDSLFSVSRVQKRMWDASGRPINHDPAVLLRTQDLPPIFEENSCLYFFTRQSLTTNRNRIGRRPQMFEMDRVEAWDIDDEVDFRVGELLLLQRRTNSRTVR